MKKASITLHPEYRIGDISPRLFGAFLEPIASMVNGSMFNPKHPTADEQGFRKDWIEKLKESGLPCLRMPGGNFVSDWEWKDSIGPKEKRRRQPDQAWHQIITNEVGLDEYLQWAEKIGTEAMVTINLGTGTLRDAMDQIDYTNFGKGTYWSDLRRANGHEAPYKVKTWYLGNEMDGPWQTGSWEKDPRGYGVLAHEVSKAMKWTDPTIETVVCASSSPLLNHYPQWDLDVLEACYNTVDYVSLHHYHSAPMGNVKALLAGYKGFENYINTEISLCDYMKTRLRSDKTMMLSFDEFGSMCRPEGKITLGMAGREPRKQFCEFNPEQKYVLHDPDDWSGRQRPRMGSEMVNTLANLTTRLTLMRHADRVKIGCATGGLGELCATDRDHVWRGAAWYAAEQLLKYGKGVSLMPVVKCDTYHTDGYVIDDMNQYGDFDDVETVQTAAALDEEKGRLTVFVINAAEEAQELEMDVRGFEGYRLEDHEEMYSEDPEAMNGYGREDVIRPAVASGTTCEKGKLKAVLQPLSWNVIRFAKEK